MIGKPMITGAAAHSWWRQRALLLAASAALLVAGSVAWWQTAPDTRSPFFWLCWAAVAAGALLVVTALLLKPGRMLASLQVIAGNALVLTALAGAIELGGRLIGVDFDSLGRHGHADPQFNYPTCFRKPDEPLGEVFFKRAGPIEWTGKPLSTVLQLRHGVDDAYRDEPEMTLRYDNEGFRNPPELKDWDVVVVGDSFTETGYLPVENIFTSVTAAQTGLRIKNLGLCDTGPFTHIEYLKRFGSAASCKTAVLAFFEGNDITDAEQEVADLQRFHATGARPFRFGAPQTSFVKAVVQMIKSRLHPPQDRLYRNASLTLGGKEIPITLQPPPMPPNPDEISPARMQLIGQFLDGWRDATARLGMKPWLIYLPINNRTYHGLWRAEPNLPPEVKDWKPGALPGLIQRMCTERGIHFVDTCGILRAAAESGVLVYNPIFDTHLNEQGSRLVGEALARALQDAAIPPKRS